VPGSLLEFQAGVGERPFRMYIMGGTPIIDALYDVFKSPSAAFQRAVEAAGLAARVHYLSHGDTHTYMRPA